MEKHESDRLVFIKLGGSLISDKTKPETLRGEVLDRIARYVYHTAVVNDSSRHR